ncbi:MAG: hypothetical protein ACM3O4_02560 [Ignavibacteriales bacterium]
MKNAINYFYNLVTYDIHQIGKTHYFTIDDASYVLMPYDRLIGDINSLYEISTNLFRRNIYCHQIIMSNRRELVTNINGEQYILLRIYINNNDKISIDDILYFNFIEVGNQYESLKKDNWYTLWTRKIDYYEDQVREFGKKYPLIRESFSYFVGITETGIILLQNAETNKNPLVIAHKRIKYTTTYFELYNPLNFVVDCKARNISEYLEDLYINDKITIEEIKNYLSYSNLNSNELYLFFVRLFYPSFYFDVYDDIILNQKEDDELKEVIKKIPKYESLLKEMYLFLKNYISLPDIEWIIKI